jgi:hypothetical protein
MIMICALQIMICALHMANICSCHMLAARLLAFLLMLLLFTGHRPCILGQYHTLDAIACPSGSADLFVSLRLHRSGAYLDIEHGTQCQAVNGIGCRRVLYTNM